MGLKTVKKVRDLVEAKTFKHRHFKLRATVGHCEPTPRVQKVSKSIRAFIQPPVKGLRILSSGECRLLKR